MTLTENIETEIAKIVREHGSERENLIDVLQEIQDTMGCISGDAIDSVSKATGFPRVEIEGIVTFYHFLRKEPAGKTVIYLSTGAIPSINGVLDVAEAMEEEAGLGFGEGTSEDPVGLEWTSCMGMNDQEPSALVKGAVITDLTPDTARELVKHLKNGGSPQDFEHKKPVRSNLHKPGKVVFGERKTGDAVKKLVGMTREEVLEEMKKSGLRGRGGAGFPIGMKWDFCLKNESDTRYIICNADEGEPGTFKDRVILTEIPELVFEGMTVGGYVLGATEGIFYLRAEYRYLRPHLEETLEKLRKENLLGKNIAGKEGFNFDIKIRMGAGAYVCGEETALIESAEGKRGEPRDRPPFPVAKGFENRPSAVNNVETLCCAARIVEEGADWFRTMGTDQSTGTKVISISGDCSKPGVYEIDFGTPISELLEMAGAENPYAVQVGGPSGTCINKNQLGRLLAFEDICTGGSVIVIGEGRDLLQVVTDFMEFFVEESCGYCTPCRMGNTLLLDKLNKIRSGRGTKKDVEHLKITGKTVSGLSRCGLGLTSPNPILTTIDNFPDEYEKLLSQDEFISPHDLEKAIEIGRKAAGIRES